MRVFISWSGDASRAVASALRDWLPQCLQSVQPWLSGQDLDAGERWAVGTQEAIESSQAAILCVTWNSLQSQWMNFEAGALSRWGPTTPIFPFLIDLRPTDLNGPLALYQAVVADMEGTFLLLKALNEKSERPLSLEQLRRVFELWWPQLQERLAQIVVEYPSDPFDRLAQIVAEPAPLSSATEPGPEKNQVAQLQLLVGRLEKLVLGVQDRSLQQSVSAADAEVRSGGRPKVFIGSSSEGLAVAEAIQLGLDHVAECDVWNQGPFRPSLTGIESLVEASAAFAYAVVVLTADDLVTRRGATEPAPRDNLIFEIGLFTGSLGRARTFVVQNHDEELHLPSDLNGVTTVRYRPRSDGNLVSALAPVCYQIRQAMGLV